MICWSSRSRSSRRKLSCAGMRSTAAPAWSFKMAGGTHLQVGDRQERSPIAAPGACGSHDQRFNLRGIDRGRDGELAHTGQTPRRRRGGWRSRSGSRRWCAGWARGSCPIVAREHRKKPSRAGERLYLITRLITQRGGVPHEGTQALLLLLVEVDLGRRAVVRIALEVLVAEVEPGHVRPDAVGETAVRRRCNP